MLKHTVLLATLEHLIQKEAALTVIDTHAGAGLYRLDGDYATTSSEAVDGIGRLIAGISPAVDSPPAAQTEAKAEAKTLSKLELTPVLQAYLALIAQFNAGKSTKVYPGSPFIIQHKLRSHDKLKLFELHPTDSRTLSANVAQLKAGRQVAVLREDGFSGVKKFIPPPARRALVLCDPSYELKTDYQQVVEMVADALKRFATGTYVVWYPIIPRPEAHDLPRKLKTLATRSGKAWLHLSLTVKSSKLLTNTEGEIIRPGLPASGMFLINPPHTLKAEMQKTLPQLVALLGQDKNAGFEVEHGGA